MVSSSGDTGRSDVISDAISERIARGRVFDSDSMAVRLASVLAMRVLSAAAVALAISVRLAARVLFLFDSESMASMGVMVAQRETRA